MRVPSALEIVKFVVPAVHKEWDFMRKIRAHLMQKLVPDADVSNRVGQIAKQKYRVDRVFIRIVVGQISERFGDL